MSETRTARRGDLVRVGPAYRMGGTYAPDGAEGVYTVVDVRPTGDALLVRGNQRGDGWTTLPLRSEGDLGVSLRRCTVIAPRCEVTRERAHAALAARLRTALATLCFPDLLDRTEEWCTGAYPRESLTREWCEARLREALIRAVDEGDASEDFVLGVVGGAS